jgi:5-methyltetrahydrofolate--homocysteine methyltransferase
MDDLAAGRLTATVLEPEKAAITVLHRGAASVPLTADGQSSWVKRDLARPEPPFWGVRDASLPVADLFEYLDTFSLIRNRWSFTQGTLTDEAFATLLREKAEPLLAQLKEQLTTGALITPKGRYGYFPAQASGDELKVWDPERTKVLATMTFPRQATGRRLALPDFFEPESSGRFDVLGLQLVTLGQGPADHTAQLHAENRYSEYFTFHGLSAELTEAYAECLHARMRRELGIHQKDAQELRQLFSQGYQGSRYSYGYPACPDLEGNGAILELLDGGSIGVTLSEAGQMVPEFTTSALVAWHPQARYFSV